MIDDTKECYLCGRKGILHRHHMIHGNAGRKKAEKYGLVCYLCPDCHMRVHDFGVGDRFLQKKAQKYFEQQYGHDEWMRIFGKNYL